MKKYLIFFLLIGLVGCIGRLNRPTSTPFKILLTATTILSETPSLTPKIRSTPIATQTLNLSPTETLSTPTPGWSLTGEQIFFNSDFPEFGIYAYSLSSGTVQIIDVFDYQSISPDGRWLIDSWGHLDMLNLVTGDQVFVPIPDDCGRFPSVSPDSNWVINTIKGLQILKICSLNHESILTSSATVTTIYEWEIQDPVDFINISWSPDGDKVAFRAFPESLTPHPNAGIYIIHLDCEEKYTDCRVEDKGPLLPKYGSGYGVWSADSKYLAFAPYDENKIMILDSDTGFVGRIIDVTNSRLRSGIDIAWSPDNNYLAVSKANGLYIFSMETAEWTRILNISYPHYLEVIGWIDYSKVEQRTTE